MKRDILTEDSAILDGRIPYRMTITEDGTVLFRWLYTGAVRFTEPFFDETIATCLSLPENSSAIPFTTADVLLKRAASTDAVPPSGIIYHVSRCGSTLLSQMLSANEEMIVLSEVPLIDEIIRAPTDKIKGNWSAEQMVTAVIALLGRRKATREKYLFIKTDSWHMLFHETFHLCYPDAPVILLYRAPHEVLASHEKLPGMQAVPGLLPAEWFGLRNEDAVNMTRQEYLSHVLESYYRTFSNIIRNDQHAEPVSYHEGPVALLKAISIACKIHFQPPVMESMLERSAFHSKNSSVAFSGDAHPCINVRNDTMERAFGELNSLASAK